MSGETWGSMVSRRVSIVHADIGRDAVEIGRVYSIHRPVVQ
jgi:hypothetical protein